MTASRSTKILLALFGAHLLLKVLLFGEVAHVARYGDEAYYLDSAKALSNLVRDLVGAGPVHLEELRRNVVGNGWFMPGNSILLTPLYLVDPDASITVVRIYLGVVTSLLLLVTALRVRSVLGDLYAGLLIVGTGLVPMWVLYSFAAWGDLVAGLLIVLMVLELVTVIRTLRHGDSPTWRDAVRLGLVAIAVVYARSSASLLVAGMAVVLVIVATTLLRGRVRLRAFGAVGLAGVLFAALLAPWSLFASSTLGGRVVTTTSVPVVLANTFGDRTELCFGPCDPTSTIWFSPTNYSREVARATGTNELVVQKQMSSYARRDVTASSYARDVGMDFARYTLQPAAFTRYLLGGSEGRPTPANLFVTVLTDLLWGLLVLGIVGTLLRVVRRPVELQVLGLLITLGLGSLLTQPFVHIAGSRYWTSAAPLAALGLALLVQLADLRRSTPRFAAGSAIMAVESAPADTSAVPAEVISRWLTIVQTGLAAAVVLTVVALVTLALT
ncbi:MAG: hypothetical protein ACJ72D_22575 [Marmoricola sp.]